MERGKDGSYKAGPKNSATGCPATPKAEWAAPCRAEEPGGGIEPRCPRGRVVKATSPLTPNHNPKPVMEAPKQAEVTAMRKTAKSKKLQSKPTVAPKPGTETTKKISSYDRHNHG